MCSDQHIKYRKPRGFPLTSNPPLDYHVKEHIKHVKQYIHTQRDIFDKKLPWLSANLSEFTTRNEKIFVLRFSGKITNNIFFIKKNLQIVLLCLQYTTGKQSAKQSSL